jgi:hypothetical protein
VNLNIGVAAITLCNAVYLERAAELLAKSRAFDINPETLKVSDRPRGFQAEIDLLWVSFRPDSFSNCRLSAQTSGDRSSRRENCCLNS